MRIPGLRSRIEEAFNKPTAELSRWIRFVRLQFELWRFCARRLRRNNLVAMSAALSFRTIFAMIPALILGFLILRSLGVVEDGKQTLRKFLENSGIAQIAAFEPLGDATAEPGAISSLDGDSRDKLPATGRVINVADEIEDLISQAEDKLTFERIGPIGALLMIWTAMALLITLESSLNRIFEAPRSRAVSRRIVLYWATITLGPILIVAAGELFQSAVEASAGLPGIEWVAAAMGWFATALVGMFVVAMGYKLIPNTHVHFSSAFGGALIAVPLWLLARWGFAIYVERFVLQGNLYGVLGLFPLFMLWINISWTILLFGAQLAHTAANLGQLRAAESAAEPAPGPSAFLAVATSVARTYAAGNGPATLSDVSTATGLPAECTHRILDRLIQAEILCQTDSRSSGRYILPRPSEHIRVLEVLDLADHGFSELGRGSGNVICAVVNDTVGRAREVIGETTLAEVVTAVERSTVPI